MQIPTIVRTCFLLLMLIGVPSHAQSEAVRIGYNSDSEVHRIARDRLRLVYERAGIPVEFVPLPHRRSLSNANEGLIDGDVARIYGIQNEFPNLQRVDVPLLKFVGAAYVNQDGPMVFKEELLDTMRVGILLGIQWQKNCLYGREATIQAGHYKILFDMLVEKRLDMVFAAPASADAIFQDNTAKYRHLRRLTPNLYENPLYHHVHKANAHLIPVLEQALQELIQEGSWQD